jgi:hypothetical protein
VEAVKPHRLLFPTALVLLATWPAAASGVGTGVTGKPSVSLVDEAPLVVAGRGFKAKERVRIVASTARGQYRKTVSVSRLGRFSVRFASVDASCGPLFVSAVGTRGTSASWRRVGIPPPCGADGDP